MILFSVLLFTITITNVISYNKLERERISLYETPKSQQQWFNLDVANDVLHLILNQPILEEDQFQLNVIVTNSNNASESPILENPIQLCQLLSDEIKNPNSRMSRYTFSRAFNVRGEKCPLKEGKRILLPYAIPQQGIEPSNGSYNYTLILQQCKERHCIPYIKIETLVVHDEL